MSLDFITTRPLVAPESLKYICDACIETREVGQMLEIYDPVTKILDLVSDDLKEEEVASRCFYLVKFNKTSNWHSVWLPY
jgi:hypothetical protein